jgi:TolB-like protein/Tfp pilus assembly protein PilF
MVSLLAELKRRHVYKVAVTYTVVAWVLLQVASIILPTFQAPEWAMPLCAALIVLGFPLAVALAWAYDITPEGVRRTLDLPKSDEHRHRVRQRLIYLLTGTLAITVAVLATENYLLDRAAGTAGPATVPDLDVPQLPAVALLLDVQSPESSQERLSIAVLPFKPLTASDRSESLELGMTETLISGLNRANLRTRPLSSVRRYASLEQDAIEAGQALGVQAVLEGYIQRSGDSLRISARLLEVASGRQLWAGQYNESFTDIFAVQDAIAEQIQRSLMPGLVGDTGPVLRRYTDDPEAYQLYLNGRLYLRRRTGAGLRDALSSFEQAVARDGDFALAYVGIADARSLMAVFGEAAPHATFSFAREAVDRALEIAPELGEAYASLGHIKLQYEHDWQGAESALLRAVELNPYYAPSQHWLGLYYAYMGRMDEAVERIEKARELEPLAPGYGAVEGLFLIYRGEYAAAAGLLEATLAMDPSFELTRTYLGLAQLRLGHFDSAMAELSRSRSVAPGRGGYVGQLYALSGRRAEALDEARRLIDLSEQRYVSAYDIATIFGALGEADQAFAWLDRAIEDHSQLIGWLPVEPAFEGLHDDPRFRAMIESLQLR